MANNTYPVPNLTAGDASGIYELLRYVNNVTDSLFFPMILGIIFVVTFTAGKQFSNSRAFAFASFLCLVLSVPLGVMNLVAPFYMYLFVVLTAGAAIWLKLEG